MPKLSCPIEPPIESLMATCSIVVGSFCFVTLKVSQGFDTARELQHIFRLDIPSRYLVDFPEVPKMIQKVLQYVWKSKLAILEYPQTNPTIH